MAKQGWPGVSAALAGWGLAASLAVAPAHALTYEGLSFSESLPLGGHTLVLNGVGKRQVAWLKAYAAALYLPHKADSAEAAVAGGGAKRVELRILLDKTVDTQEFVKAIHNGIGRNCGEAEQAAVAERVKTFNGYVGSIGTVRKGDVLQIDFIPGQGTVLTANGKVYGSPVPGADFYGAFLKVFLGEMPTDKRLRAGMLGQPIP